MSSIENNTWKPQNKQDHDQCVFRYTWFSSCWFPYGETDDQFLKKNERNYGKTNHVLCKMVTEFKIQNKLTIKTHQIPSKKQFSLNQVPKIKLVARTEGHSKSAYE